MLRTFAARAALAFAALTLALTGCKGDTDFTITKNFTQVNSPGSGQEYSVTRDVDLAAEAGNAWKHRDKVKSLDLVSLDATITKLNSGTLPASFSGTVVISRNGNEATAATWTNETVSAVPHTLNVQFNRDAVGLIDEALHSDGRFTVRATGSTSGAINFDAQVSLHLHMGYRVP